MSDLDGAAISKDQVSAPPHLGLRLTLARAIMLWESAWPVLWPAVGVGGLFLATALLGILVWLPGWLHGLVLLGFAGAFTWLVVQGIRRIQPPSAAAAIRRLETDSGLAHRPLTVIADRPAVGVVDPETERLWQRHLAQAAAEVRKLRLRWPHPNLAGRDPFALRIGLGILLVISLVTAGPAGPDRVRGAFTPSLQDLTDSPAASLELWITPPEYTNLPPRLLSSADPASTVQPNTDASFKIPLGSTLLAQVSHARRAPELRIGETIQTLEAVSGESWRIEVSLDEVGPQALRVNAAGDIIGAWDITVLADGPPEINFVETPRGTPTNTLQISYDVADDYGIVGIAAEITWPGVSENPALAPSAIELPLPSPNPRAGSTVSVQGLTAHPWAGLEVDIRLTATDGRGQTGHTDRLAVLLPEQGFNHPVARDIIEQRRELALSPNSRREVARALHNLSNSPRRFENDVVVFLALVSARSRLVHMQATGNVTPILSQLWDTALRLEDGALSFTQRSLARLQKELRKAIENGASDDEVRELLEKLRAALDQYLEALMQNLSQALEGMDLLSLPEGVDVTELVDSEAIQDMLEKIERMARLGDTKSVQQLMERMQRMLQALRDAPNQLQRQSNSPAREMLTELQDVVGRQQKLQDELFQRNQSGERLSEQEAQRLREAQKEIRKRLEEIRRRLGEITDQIPKNLGNAADAMGDAERAIEGGDLPGALDDQARVLAELQEGTQSMALQLLRQPGQSQQQGGIAQPGQKGFDPLGRKSGDATDNPGGFVPTSRGGISDGEQARRALEILDELRRRRLDRTRPALERDYLERLLRRF